MKNKLMIFAGLSILLSTWLALGHPLPTYAGEPGDLKTVTLLIEGMT